MAGEWIKVECSTPDKPEVFRAARRLGIDRDQVFGLLIRLWAWFDQNSVDGHVDGVTSTDVDGLVGLPGFCEAIRSVGWLEFDDDKEIITLPNFERHNGETAKKRALKNKRQERWRQKSSEKVDDEASTSGSTSASTREEKSKTVSKDTGGTPPSGADAKEVIWNLGVQILTGSGESESGARSFLGRLAKNDEAKLRDAILYCADHPKVDPKSYIYKAAAPKQRKVSV